MSKISMAKAAKLFEVSRPTLAKHREQGKISGEKIGDAWQFDMSELQRVYPRRGAKPAKPAEPLHADLTDRAVSPAGDLQAEIRVLQAELKAAQSMIEEKDKRIDDLRRMLPGPGESIQRRRWWPF